MHLRGLSVDLPFKSIGRSPYVAQPAITWSKLNNRNTRARCEICQKLIIKIPERRQWGRSGIFTDNFEHISHLVLVFQFLILNMQLPAGWDPDLKCIDNKFTLMFFWT